MNKPIPVYMTRILQHSIFLAFLLLLSCQQQMESKLGIQNKKDDFPVLSGDYLGQKLPDSIPELFAPGIVCNGMNNRDMTMTPDGSEMYFSATLGDYATILFSKRIKGNWTKPEVAVFMTGPDFMNIEPCISPDGKKFFFASDRPTSDTLGNGDFNIWVMNRKNDSWGKPQLISDFVNTEAGEFFPSITNNGTIYFTRSTPTGVHFIMRSKLIDGKYNKPEKLPAQVNCGKNRFNAFISPDESFIIVPAMGLEETYGGVDYYIVFRNADDKWSEPINLGEKINTPGNREWSASLSPDRKLLFFMSSRGLPEESQPTQLTADFLTEMQTKPQNGNADIYWISAGFIEGLKSKAEWNGD